MCRIQSDGLDDSNCVNVKIIVIYKSVKYLLNYHNTFLQQDDFG